MDTRTGRAQRAAQHSIVVLFAVALCLPLIGQLCHLGASNDRAEGRKLAALPALHARRAALVSFPAGFETYFSDHFSFRPLLLHTLSLMRTYGLGKALSESVVLGRNGWLYFTPLPLDAAVARGPQFIPEELSHWQRTLEARRDWLARRGVRYVLVIAPDKQTIYPDYFPNRLKQVAKRVSRMGEVIAYLRQHSTIEVIDLRPALSEARATAQVYYRTDSHWNLQGASIAAEQIARRLASWYPHVQPLRCSTASHGSPQSFEGDLSHLLYLPGRFVEEVDETFPPNRNAHQSDEQVTISVDQPLAAPPVVMVQKNGSLPRAVIVHDSFGGLLLPFLAESFQRAVFVALDAPAKDLIEKEHPDIVIQELAERKLAFAPGPVFVGGLEQP